MICYLVLRISVIEINITIATKLEIPDKPLSDKLCTINGITYLKPNNPPCRVGVKILRISEKS